MTSTSNTVFLNFRLQELATIPFAERTYLQDVPYHEGQVVHVNGYIDTIRRQKRITFVVLRDETASVQVVLPKKHREKPLHLDTPLYVKGRVVKAPTCVGLLQQTKQQIFSEIMMCVPDISNGILFTIFEFLSKFDEKITEKMKKKRKVNNFVSGHEILALVDEVKGPEVHDRCLQCNVKISRNTNDGTSLFCTSCSDICKSIEEFKFGKVTEDFKILCENEKKTFKIRKILSGCVEVGDTVSFKLDSNSLCAYDVVSVKPWPSFEASMLFWSPPAQEKMLEDGEKKVLIIYSGGTFGTIRNKNGEFSQPPGGGADVYKELRKYPMFSNLRLEDDTSNSSNIVFYSVKKPIDSTEATPNSWNLLAEIINTRKKFYSGFVVIHGTDTLTYTAAALSFMLAHISRPVVITGAQTSVFSSEYMVNDALMNLQGSVALLFEDVQQRNGANVPLAGTFTYFNGKVMLGSRVVKISSSSYDAFHSPNAAVLGHIKPEYSRQGNATHFVLDTLKLRFLNEERAILRRFCLQLVDPSISIQAKADLGEDPALDKFAEEVEPQKGLTFGYMVSFNTKNKTFLQKAHLHIRVYVLRLAPGCQSDISGIESAILQYHGVIVQAYGSGNAPKKIIDLLTKIRLVYKIPVAFITECHHGGTATVYDVAIPRLAAVSCRDMTLSAAYTRIFLALSFQAFVKTSNISPLELRTSQIRDEVEGNIAMPVLDCFTRTDDEEAHCRQVIAV